MIRLEELDQVIETFMLSRKQEHFFEERIVPGENHDDELAEIDAELADLLARFQAGDVDASAFGVDTARLGTEREQVRKLGTTADRVEQVDTGESIVWHCSTWSRTPGGRCCWI